MGLLDRMKAGYEKGKRETEILDRHYAEREARKRIRDQQISQQNPHKVGVVLGKVAAKSAKVTAPIGNVAVSASTAVGRHVAKKKSSTSAPKKKRKNIRIVNEPDSLGYGWGINDAFTSESHSRKPCSKKKKKKQAGSRTSFYHEGGGGGFADSGRPEFTTGSKSSGFVFK